VYMACRLASVVISVFLVMDLYRTGLAAHPAIARYGKRLVGYFLLTCCLLSLASLFFLPNSGPAKSQLLYHFLAFERTADSAVLIFLLLASAFMAWFPVRLSRNVAVFIGGFVTYFMTRWAALLAIAAKTAWVDSFNVALLSLSLACLIGWIILLRPEGEIIPVVTGRNWNPEEMDRLNAQLHAVNAKLEEFSSKSKYISLHS
jgi:hypothetical protein